jgi:hypothetical protein
LKYRSGQLSKKMSRKALSSKLIENDPSLVVVAEPR